MPPSGFPIQCGLGQLWADGQFWSHPRSNSGCTGRPLKLRQNLQDYFTLSMLLWSRPLRLWNPCLVCAAPVHPVSVKPDLGLVQTEAVFAELESFLVSSPACSQDGAMPLARGGSRQTFAGDAGLNSMPPSPPFRHRPHPLKTSQKSPTTVALRDRRTCTHLDELIRPGDACRRRSGRAIEPVPVGTVGLRTRRESHHPGLGASLSASAFHNDARN